MTSRSLQLTSQEAVPLATTQSSVLRQLKNVIAEGLFVLSQVLGRICSSEMLHRRGPVVVQPTSACGVAPKHVPLKLPSLLFILICEESCPLLVSVALRG